MILLGYKYLIDYTSDAPRYLSSFIHDDLPKIAEKMIEAAGALGPWTSFTMAPGVITLAFKRHEDAVLFGLFS